MGGSDGVRAAVMIPGVFLKHQLLVLHCYKSFTPHFVNISFLFFLAMML